MAKKKQRLERRAPQRRRNALTTRGSFARKQEGDFECSRTRQKNERLAVLQAVSLLHRT